MPYNLILVSSVQQPETPWGLQRLFDSTDAEHSVNACMSVNHIEKATAQPHYDKQVWNFKRTKCSKLQAQIFFVHMVACFHTLAESQFK